MALAFKHNSAVFVSEQDSLLVQPPLAELLTKELGSKGIKSQLYHEQHLTCRAPCLSNRLQVPAPLHRGLWAPAPQKNHQYPKTAHLRNQNIACALSKV